MTVDDRLFWVSVGNGRKQVTVSLQVKKQNRLVEYPSLQDDQHYASSKIPQPYYTSAPLVSHSC